MHLEGRMHQGYQKIRDKLKMLKDKRNEDRRRGEYGGRGHGRRRSRSRSKDRMKKEAE